MDIRTMYFGTDIVNQEIIRCEAIGFVDSRILQEYAYVDAALKCVTQNLIGNICQKIQDHGYIEINRKGSVLDYEQQFTAILRIVTKKGVERIESAIMKKDNEIEKLQSNVDVLRMKLCSCCANWEVSCNGCNDNLDKWEGRVHE